MRLKRSAAVLLVLLLFCGCDTQTDNSDSSVASPEGFSQPYAEYHADEAESEEEERSLFNEDDISDGCVEGYNEGYYHALVGEEPPYYEKSEDNMELSEWAAEGYFTEDDYWEFYTVSYFEGYGDALSGTEPRYGADHGEDIDEIPDLPPQQQEPSAPEPASGMPQEQGKSITVYVTKTGDKYHKENCRYLWNSKIPKPLSDAKTHYTACSVCQPPQ